jgi:hypothetical protein
MGSSASDAGFFGSRRGLRASLSFARRLVGRQREVLCGEWMAEGEYLGLECGPAAE